MAQSERVIKDRLENSPQFNINRSHMLLRVESAVFLGTYVSYICMYIYIYVCVCVCEHM